MKESLFKKILWADILCWPLLFAAFYFQPQYVSDLYGYSESLPSFLNSGLELTLAITGLALYIVSYILLFRFNKLGRTLYLISFIYHNSGVSRAKQHIFFEFCFSCFFIFL